MFSLSYVNLKPLMWSQEIRHYPSTKVGEGEEVTIIQVTCAPDAKCDLLLSDGAKIRDHEISITIIPGEIKADERQKTNLLNQAIGGLWFLEEEDFVHGRFYFKSNNFTALWDQVRDGGYVDCVICLGVDPVQDNIWKGNPLSIVSVAINFSRKSFADKTADEQAARKSWFARR